MPKLLASFRMKVARRRASLIFVPAKDTMKNATFLFLLNPDEFWDSSGGKRDKSWDQGSKTPPLWCLGTPFCSLALFFIPGCHFHEAPPLPLTNSSVTICGVGNYLVWEELLGLQAAEHGKTSFSGHQPIPWTRRSVRLLRLSKVWFVHRRSRVGNQDERNRKLKAEESENRYFLCQERKKISGSRDKIIKCFI